MDPNANIIFGALVDESMSGEIAITVIATGFPVQGINADSPGQATVRQAAVTKEVSKPVAKPAAAKPSAVEEVSESV